MFKTLAELRRWCESAPNGTTLSPAAVAEALAAVADLPEPEPVAAHVPDPSWRERLWIAPAETRLDVEEAAEAIGRPRSAVYKLTSARKIPHRKLDGMLVFRAGELRAWLRDTEEVTVPGRLYLVPSERAAEVAS